MAKTKTIKVYPNPWGVHPLAVAKGRVTDHGLDPRDLPSHTVQHEGAAGVYVGARVHPTLTKVDGLPIHESLKKYSKYVQGVSPRQETVWEFSGVAASDPDFCAKFAATQPIEVPNTPYYYAALRSADLLPGDGAAASLAGYQCRPSDFASLERFARKCAGLEEQAAKSDETTAPAGARSRKAD